MKYKIAIIFFFIIIILSTLPKRTIIIDGRMAQAELSVNKTIIPDGGNRELNSLPSQEFIVTAYNTVKWQTDNTPCIAASGKNICGRKDVIACPRRYKFGTRFVIEGKTYICEDRLALKYDNRIDISFGKDIEGAKRWGIKKIKVSVIKN